MWLRHIFLESTCKNKFIQKKNHPDRPRNDREWAFWKSTNCIRKYFFMSFPRACGQFSPIQKVTLNCIRIQFLGSVVSFSAILTKFGPKNPLATFYVCVPQPEDLGGGCFLRGCSVFSETFKKKCGRIYVRKQKNKIFLEQSPKKLPSQKFDSKLSTTVSGGVPATNLAKSAIYTKHRFWMFFIVLANTVPQKPTLTLCLCPLGPPRRHMSKYRPHRPRNGQDMNHWVKSWFTPHLTTNQRD
jgi:hypothetical protein